MSQKTIRTVGLPFEAGIIDIGAHSVRLEIFQVAKDGSVEPLAEEQYLPKTSIFCVRY